MPTAIAKVSTRDAMPDDNMDLSTVTHSPSPTSGTQTASIPTTVTITTAAAVPSSSSSSSSSSSFIATQKQQKLPFIQQQQWQRQLVFAQRQRQLQQQQQNHQQQYIHHSSPKQPSVALVQQQINTPPQLHIGKQQHHCRQQELRPMEEEGKPQPQQNQQERQQKQLQQRQRQQDDQQHEGKRLHRLQGPAEIDPPKASSSLTAVASASATAAAMEAKMTAPACQSQQQSQWEVDLVDDVWRMIFYMLASSCRDLGRTMQVNRRFHNLIASDASLWKLTYKLTVSGSIFSCQKSLLGANPSPSTVVSRSEQQQKNINVTQQSQQSQQPHQEHSSGKETCTDTTDECCLSRRNPPSSPVDRNMMVHSVRGQGENEGPGPESGSGSCYLQSKKSDSLQDESAPCSWSEPSTESSASSRRHSAPQQPSPQQQQKQQPQRSNSVGDIYDPQLQHWGEGSRAGTIGFSPALQIPSALVLPHHRRMAQAALSSHNNLQPIVDRTIDPTALPSSISGSSSSHSLQGSVGVPSTPASTPVSHTGPSFQSTIPATVSQVHSNSTIPLSSIVYPHHIPTTTLMHHPPAVYWKYQVVEWLEQEKLRCLRLGLFWGFNADSSRSHSRRDRRNPTAPIQ